jgi:TPR repeat protein
MGCLRIIALALLAALFASGCDFKFGEKSMATSDINWKSLEFTCVHQKDTWPKMNDPQVNAWFRDGAKLYQEGDAQENKEMLKQGFDLTLKAAERNHVVAMSNLVRMYLDGYAVKEDESKAVEWAEKLIKMNISLGYYHMGTFLEQGIGVRKDRTAALAYFRKSADLGDPQGQLVTGGKIADAFVQRPSDEKERGFFIARSMYQCAIEQGLGEAGYELGMHYKNYEKKMPEALRAFQTAGKLGNTQSLFTLAELFEEGGPGVGKDPARAACYRRLEAESDEDKTKKFPNIDTICPLPPAPMPS